MKKNEHGQNYIASPTGIANNNNVTVPEIWPGQNLGVKKEKKNNKANWMVSYSAKLDSRIKQHTQFGVSASNCSRDMAWTKVAEKKKKKKVKKRRKKMNTAKLYSIPYGDR